MIATAQEDGADMRRMRASLAHGVEVAALALGARAAVVPLGGALMAAAAAEHGVITEERKTRARVGRELTIGAPAARRVALRARPRHAPHVPVLVTRSTSAHVVIAIASIVTARAWDALMPAEEGRAGQAVIEARGQAGDGVEALLIVTANASTRRRGEARGR